MQKILIVDGNIVTVPYVPTADTRICTIYGEQNGEFIGININVADNGIIIDKLFGYIDTNGNVHDCH